MMKRLAVLSIALAAGGCDADRGPFLADLPGLEVHAAVYMTPDPGDPPTSARAEVTVFLIYDADAFRRDHGDRCAQLDASVAGEIEGVALSLAHAGSGGGSVECSTPRLESSSFEVPVRRGDAPVTLVIVDASTEIEATFRAAVLEPRVAQRVSHDQWRFAAGDHATFTWSHPGDFEYEGAPDALGFEVEGDELAIAPVPARFENGLIEADFPDPLELTGEVTFTMHPHFGPELEPAGQSIGCEGAVSCRFDADLVVRQPIELVP